MSYSDRFSRGTFFAFALMFVVGCGGPSGDEAPADESLQAAEPTPTADETRAFNLPPAGTTGTPADNVTDPAMNDLPNPYTTIEGWARLHANIMATISHGRLPIPSGTTRLR